MALLETSPEGLGSAEAARRLAVRGPNAIVEGRPRSWAGLLGAQFLDVPILVLVGAAVIAGFIGDVVDTVVILAIVVLNAAIGFSQEWRAERALAALKAMTATRALAVRDGRPVSVPTQELVPGDIVRIEAGSIVPADLRLIEAAAVRTNEAPLTGESVPVDKATDVLHATDTAVAERSNLLHKGTYVTHGRAVGVVVETGMTTEFGRIAALLRDVQAAQTPLQLRLARLGRILAGLVIVVCVIVFTTGVLRGEGWMPMLLTALSLAVAAIPEALPAVVTVSLALGAERAERDVMRRPPRPVREGMFARGLGVHILWVGLLMAGLTLGTQAWFVASGEEQVHWQTLTFTMLCFVQLGHVLAVRSERESLFRLRLFSNRPLLGAVLLAIALQLAVIYVPAMNALFRTAPLSTAELGLAFAGAALVFGGVEIEKKLRSGRS